ncbi:MAG TPA: ester cyclase [Candidatus Binatia bacterium]|nr:ester cyclase [Candidatus Binatia bacterium]
MSTNSYKDGVAWFFAQVFNEGNFQPIDDLIGDNYTFNGQHQTRDQLKQWVTGLRAELAGLHFDHNDLLGDGCQVAIRWTLFGTKDGVLMTNTGTNILTFGTDGKCLSNWQNGGTPADLHPAGQQQAAA